MPLISRLATLAAKLEGTPGTAETLTGSEVIATVYDPVMTPTIELIDRPMQGVFTMSPSAVGMQSAVCTFRTDFIGGGGGATPAPPWMELLFPACGWTQTLEVFEPTTVPVGGVGGHTTLTLGLYINGKRKLMSGAVGTYVITAEVGKPIQVEFTFTGKWAGESDQTLLTSTSAGVPIRYVNDTPAITGWTFPCLQSLIIDAGNEVVLRECQTDVTAGYATGVITNRKTLVTINPESELVATNNTYADWIAAVEADALAVVFADATDTCTLHADGMQIQSITAGDRNGIAIDDVTLQCNDDDLKFTWTAT